NLPFRRRTSPTPQSQYPQIPPRPKRRRTGSSLREALGTRPRGSRKIQFHQQSGADEPRDFRNRRLRLARRSAPQPIQHPRKSPRYPKTKQDLQNPPNPRLDGPGYLLVFEKARLALPPALGTGIRFRRRLAQYFQTPRWHDRRRNPLQRHQTRVRHSRTFRRSEERRVGR